jgi:hypothetical protein
VTIAAPQLAPAYLWLAPAIGLACIGTLATAADLGTTSYLVSLLPVLACGVGFLILKAIEQPRNAIACLLVFFVFVPRDKVVSLDSPLSRVGCTLAPHRSILT